MFDIDTELLPVDQESRDLICIGNMSKHKLKVQFSVISGCDYYEIRTVPSIVTLKRGFACEFEIFIKPLCSCKIVDNVLVTGLDINSGEIKEGKIAIETNTENSTKLFYQEIEETKKLGEGSFGIVYKGLYRGNDVAIKKMKESKQTAKNMEEFENEVSMLDKFRSEYLVHFFGAVFVPNKICMVTEFAKYGSIQDLMKHKNSNEIDLNLRVKFMLNGAEGILYLHENGILHRDIKPDNFLIFSLDPNEKVNAKLTDFGSARNINMLMTNMTFTKGIGTPKYMAPEVLNKKKYKKSADVFSFGVTLYECFSWKMAYQKDDVRFKFAWGIADFITSGKRLENITNISKEMNDLISKCWVQEQEKRLTIQEVVGTLQNLNQR
ncbi:serine/threonine protein kinase HT1, putative [Entamoeba invadens IP1]|uniref:Serine/threonine protein kinase HT1, putative n=1 Tax=Entamoeba invadens IP1 TaxID=370355 RepID=L7FP63_ENTIV|nr:serine/threonine protein kinase HT1, putative [Entamoeba invadens IP1]ELP94538.1 serine/threonine protein kinase HT1, putative [Entamoeba invadens IP1]|eukprot:XP_004261309.1 serine/threonine protein kinase HT1, putative [Entamoeba invadens IP1]